MTHSTITISTAKSGFYKDGVRQTATDRKKLKKLLPKVVKIHYREKMAEAASWMLQPEIGHN